MVPLVDKRSGAQLHEAPAIVALCEDFLTLNVFGCPVIDLCKPKVHQRVTMRLDEAKPRKPLY